MYSLDRIMLSFTQGGKSVFVRASDISQVFTQIPQGKHKVVGSVLVIDSEQSIVVDQSVDEISSLLVEINMIVIAHDEVLEDDKEEELDIEEPT